MEERVLLLARRLGGTVFGSVILWLGTVLWQRGQLPVHAVAVIASVSVYALGLLVLTLSFTSLIRRPWWDRLVLLGLLFSLATTFGVLATTVQRTYGTDSLAMMHASAEMLLAGQNPYSSRGELLAAANRFGVPVSFVTYTVGGEPVPRVATYPAGQILAFVPFLAFGVGDLRWVLLGVELVTLILLWRAAPVLLRPLVLLPIVANPDLFLDFTVGSVTDWLWVLPLVGTILSLESGRLKLSGLLYGLAAGIKQQPWFLAPFLLVWVWQRARAGDRRRAVRVFASVAAGTFVILNAPFALWDVQGWFAGAFQPLLLGMIPSGQGLSALTVFGFAQIPRPAYLAAMLVVWGALVVAYGRFFDRLQYAAPMLAALPLWFSPRSLHSYFLFWIPVSMASMLGWWMRAQTPETGSVNREAVPSGPSARGPFRRWSSLFRLPTASGRLAVALLALAIVAGGTLGRARTDSGISVAVLGLRDHLSVGAVTAIDLEVGNDSARPLRPRFSVQWHGHPFTWEIAEGPETLAPGERGRYTIVTPDPSAAPRGPLPGPEQPGALVLSGPFRVRVNDAASSVYEIPEPVEARLSRPGILNPSFALWTAKDPTYQVSGPSHWKLVLSGSPGESAVKQATLGGERAAELQVTQDGQQDWVEAGLRQQITFPACGFSVRVFRRTAFAKTKNGDLGRVFGLAVEDEQHLPLYIAFADETKHVPEKLSDGARLVLLKTERGEWSDVPIDLASLYDELGWKRPLTVNLTFFVGASAEHSGTLQDAVTAVRGITEDCVRLPDRKGGS